MIRFRASDPIDHDSVHPQSLTIVYDTAPPLHVSTQGESPSSGGVDGGRVRDGDNITVTTTWDQPGYVVTVDFSGLDSTFEEPIVARDRNDSQYVADYTVSSDNARPDGLRTIVVTAEDDAGNKTVMNIMEGVV